jgi:hypothetical protein
MPGWPSVFFSVVTVLVLGIVGLNLVLAVIVTEYQNVSEAMLNESRARSLQKAQRRATKNAARSFGGSSVGGSSMGSGDLVRACARACVPPLPVVTSVCVVLAGG